MYFLVLLFLACAVVASAAKTSFRYSPELYFKKGEKYKILGTETLAVVVEDLDRQHAHSKTPKLAIKLCKGIGAGKHTCMLPMSIISLGLPTTKKTLLFNGINVAVQLDQAEKSITLVGLLSWCDSDYCGDRRIDAMRMTFVPTTESPQLLIESNPAQVLQLHVSNGFSGGLPRMIAGADNQLIAISGYQKPVSFFTIGDGTSTELQEPTSTQLLIPVGDNTDTQYVLPTFYDGTQYWLRCGCGQDKDLRSSLDKDLVWSFPDIYSSLGYTPIVSTNGVLWLLDDRNSLTTFKRYNSATRQSLSDFHVNSEFAKSYRGGSRGGFSMSSDGSILYIVMYDQNAKSMDILSISTTTNEEINLVRGKVPLPSVMDRNEILVCGTAMTTKGLAVCLTDTFENAKTMFVHFYAV